MILVDTSVWIEFLKAKERTFSVLRAQLENHEVLAVEWIFGELLQGAKTSRESEIITKYWESLPKVSANGIWIEAGAYSSANKLHSKGIGLIDFAILIAARRSNARLWTLDKSLKNLLQDKEVFNP